MRLLVTGGAGYIGSVAAEALLARGHAVCVVDDLSRGHKAAVPTGIPFEIVSTLDLVRLRDFLSDVKPDGILHFAASSLVPESMRDPGKYFHNNVLGIVTLLEACVQTSCRKILFSSSAAVYGDPVAVPIPEDAPMVPTNPYGESKKICEQVLEWYRRVHGFRFGSLRYFNAAGASETRGEDHDPETHLIPLALDAALGLAPPLRVFGVDYPTPDGTCIRDYIHVVDLAEAHLLALEKLDETDHLILNLGNGAGFSVLEVIRTIEKLSGRPVPWEAAARRAGDPPRLVASSTRAREVLGWAPRRPSLEAIVETAYRWKRDHPHGYAQTS